MQDSNVPAKFTIPWANGAGASYINAIPTASQIGINNGYASLTDGFVPLNDTPIASGGVPPRIKDWNGILNEITAWNRWQQAGGTLAYDATFSAAIGGYPKNAILSVAASPGKFWVSTVDNNTTDPDTGGAGWAPLVENLFATVVAKNTAYTILPADNGTYFSVSATTTITFPVPSGITSGFPLGIGNNGAGVVTIDTNGTTVYLPTGPVSSTFTMQPGDFFIADYDGAAWRVLGGSAAILGAAKAGIANRETMFTSSGSWTAPVGITQIFVDAAAGGGGASLSSGSTGGSGGGGGAAVVSASYTVVPGNVYAVTIGSAGAGGSTPTAGGTTSLGSLFSLTGGGAGIAGGAGGSAGGAGGLPGLQGTQSAPSGVTISWGGAGGGSLWGAGGAPGNGVTNGSSASGFGGGGGGGQNATPGNGSPGFIRIRY